jgi:protein-S-isoprenylcysteine O-methyltransferase Ste14
MYPILLILYYWLARREEKILQKEFGEAYLKYKESTPMFFPIKLYIARQKTANYTQVL